MGSQSSFRLPLRLYLFLLQSLPSFPNLPDLLPSVLRQLDHPILRDRHNMLPPRTPHPAIKQPPRAAVPRTPILLGKPLTPFRPLVLPKIHILSISMENDLMHQTSHGGVEIADIHSIRNDEEAIAIRSVELCAEVYVRIPVGDCADGAVEDELAAVEGVFGLVVG